MRPPGPRADELARVSVQAHSTVRTMRSGPSLPPILGEPQRVTATFHRMDGRTLHVRKATLAEPRPRKICDAPGLDPAPGCIRQMIVRPRDQPKEARNAVSHADFCVTNPPKYNKLENAL